MEPGPATIELRWERHLSTVKWQHLNLMGVLYSIFKTRTNNTKNRRKESEQSKGSERIFAFQFLIEKKKQAKLKKFEKFEKFVRKKNFIFWSKIISKCVITIGKGKKNIQSLKNE